MSRGNEVIVKLHPCHAAESLLRGFCAHSLKHACGLYRNVATRFSHSSLLCQILVDTRPKSCFDVLMGKGVCCFYVHQMHHN